MFQMLLPAAILFSPEQQAGAAKPAPKPAAQGPRETESPSRSQSGRSSEG
jgi:hypothetical protein